MAHYHTTNGIVSRIRSEKPYKPPPAMEGIPTISEEAALRMAMNEPTPEDEEELRQAMQAVREARTGVVE